MLEELADRHGIGAPDVTKAMDRHADKLLDVAVSRVRRQLERKIKSVLANRQLPDLLPDE
jgi:hypothetical protein